MAIQFVVEDGTGLSNATSYTDLAFANQYIEDYVSDVTAWNAATDDQKKQALNRATTFLDLQYTPLQGYRILEAQSLNWPRNYVTDRDGYAVDSDVVPVRVKQATVEVANYIINGNEVFAQLDSEGKLKAETIRIDVITIQKQWTGSNVTASLKAKIDGYIAEFLSSGGSKVNAEVRRG